MYFTRVYSVLVTIGGESVPVVLGRINPPIPAALIGLQKQIQGLPTYGLFPTLVQLGAEMLPSTRNLHSTPRV